MKPITRIFLWLGFTAIFFIPWLWYEGAELIIGGDLTFPLNPAEYFNSIFHIWRRVYTGGNSAISLTTLPFYAPMALFDALGFSLQTVQKLHFGLWLALPAISMFYLSGVLFAKHRWQMIGQLTAVTLYLFNTYEVVWADSARMAVWVGLPLILAFFIQGLRDKGNWPIWASAIALTSVVTSTAAANPPMFLMFLAVLIFWLIFHLATTPADRQWPQLRQIGRLVLASFLLAILINLFWIVPYAAVLVRDYGNALSSGLEGIQFKDWLDPVSTNTSILNVLRLQGAWDWYAGWQGEPYVPAAHPYQHNPFYLFWSLLVPITAFSALLVRDRRLRPYIIFFAGLSLVGLLFSAGSHEPTGRLYRWLVERIPFLSIYRSPWYKFSTWVVLGYSILGGVTLMALADYLSRQSGKVFRLQAIYGLTALFIVGNLIYSSGLVMGRVFPKQSERKRLHSAHITFPDYFFRSADWANRQTGDWRIMQLPAQPAFNYHWGLGTLMDMTIFSFRQPTLWWPEQTGSGPAKEGSERLVKEVYDQIYYGSGRHLNRLLGLLNVRYLLQKDDIDYSFYGTKDSPEFISERLAKLDLQLAHQEGPWRFFQVPDDEQRPLIFSANRYVQTEPALSELLPILLSADYDSAATYGSLATDQLPTTIERSVALAPKLERTTLAGSNLMVPFNVQSDGLYRFSFDDGEAIALTIDDRPIDLRKSSGKVLADVQLSAGDHRLTVSQPNGFVSLIANPSFETGLWEEPIDASLTWPGRADFSAELISRDGDQALKLSSRGHSAAMRKGIDRFEANRHYLLMFDYRYGIGQPPKFSLSQEGSNVIEPSAELPKNSQWSTYSTVFRPRPFTTGAYLFLYADPTREAVATENYYDNVRVIKLPKALETMTLQTAVDRSSAPPNISYERLSPTEYRITVKEADRPYFINFLEQFDKGWQLSVPAKHFQSFGYANSWFIEKEGDYEIRLSFRPQSLFRLAALISLMSVLIGIAYLVRYRRHSAAEAK